jgi:hypothetical protein
MKIFNNLFEKISQKLYEKFSENYSKWFFEKIGDALIIQIPIKDNISPRQIKEYVEYTRKLFEKHLETLGVKEIIVVANLRKQ